MSRLLEPLTLKVFLVEFRMFLSACSTAASSSVISNHALQVIVIAMKQRDLASFSKPNSRFLC